MVEAQKVRIEQEMTNMVNQLDKNYLRKMQVCLGYVSDLFTDKVISRPAYAIKTEARVLILSYKLASFPCLTHMFICRMPTKS